MNEYLEGSVRQLIERGRQLTATIPRNLPRDYDTLARTCREKLIQLNEQLRSLLDDPRFSYLKHQPERLRSFKRLVAELDLIETMGIAALDRANDEDHKLNSLLETITREIAYPFETPVVTTLSQQYFCIVTDLNLLCVPLAEGRFLLHLPDLYHELAHPLLTLLDDPIVEPFQNAMLFALQETIEYLDAESIKQDRRRGPERPTITLQRWKICWVKYWMVEFFCDLFAVLVLGPAFAWSHFHLCAKRGQNPFDVPLFGTSSHPADDARMRVMIVALKNAGFASAADNIAKRWSDLVGLSGYILEPEYHQCFPDSVLESISRHALSGVSNIGCRIASPSTADQVHSALNSAWEQFWLRPTEYVEWERAEVTRMIS